jgi:hypothetical protein
MRTSAHKSKYLVQVINIYLVFPIKLLGKLIAVTHPPPSKMTEKGVTQILIYFWEFHSVSVYKG